MLRLNTTIFMILALTMMAFSAPAHGQFEDAGKLDLGEFGDLGGVLGNQPSFDDSLELESFIVPEGEGKPAQLVIRANIGTGWNIYSLTQKPGGPPKTEITLYASEKFELIDGFVPQEKPKVSVKQDIWPDLEIEEHFGVVTWIAPIRFAEGVDPSSVTISGELTKGQVCHPKKGCFGFGIALEPKFTAELATADQIASVRPAAAPVGGDTGEYDDARNNLVIRGFVEPQVVAPGDTAKLHLSIEMDEGWHVYEREESVESGRPTLIPLVNTSGLEPLAPIVDGEVIEKDGLRYHPGKTTWTIDFPIKKTTAAGDYPIEGHIAYLSCSDKTCLSPSAVKFNANIQVGVETSGQTSAVAFTKSSYGVANQATATQVAWADPSSANSNAETALIDYEAIQEQEKKKVDATSLPVALAMALAAGFILNFMPCVLPVIGLKVMSFVQQAGEDRTRAFTLNAVYALGILSVFWVLATLAVFAGFTWGVTQFQSVEFNVILGSVVFVFALSFLGVWEVPIPGFVGSGKAAEAAEREGLSGAFAKGILTTVLATPCTGPLLGPALAWAVAKPPVLSYVIFTCVGLGMALPYLIIGAQPKLLRFLPRPGAWMETFKNVMGFVLMATVVFILSYMPSPFVVPTITMMFGLWAACWWVGRKQKTGAQGTQLATAWAGATTFGIAIGLVAFMWLAGIMKSRSELAFSKRVNTAVKEILDGQGESTAVVRQRVVPKGQFELPWEQFSKETMERHVAGNRTVLIDFTADWCFVCKRNESKALNTEEMLSLVNENDVVTLKADLTNDSPEAEEMLRLLGQSAKGLPVYVIFPAGSPNKPILFTGPQTKNFFLDKVREAGPSQSAADAQRTAMRPTSNSE